MALGLTLGWCLPIMAQDAAPAVESASEPPAAAPARAKPRPKPKAKLKAEKPPEPSTDTAPASPVLRPTQDGSGTRAAPTQGMAQTPTARPPRSATIACEAGQAILYEGDQGSAVWVTRAGQITIDNPLRPLTPDTTRVLQLVIGNRTATAYGADWDALRRGGAPGTLEAQIGGSIRWDASLPTLPDALNIVADSGASLTELPFKTCGEAPAVRAASAPAPKRSSTKVDAPSTTAKPSPRAAKPSRLPSGALPE